MCVLVRAELGVCGIPSEVAAPVKARLMKRGPLRK